MRAMTNSLFDIKLAFQSFPSLLLTLVAMIFTSAIFSSAASQSLDQGFPFIFQSSIILCFKGNIELGYVMHISTNRKINRNGTAFWQIAVENSCFILVQSFIIGLFVGLLSIVNIYIKNITLDFHLVLALVTSSLITCFLSTLVFILSFLSSLEMTLNFSMDHETFFMPVFNAINDILVVEILFYFSKNIKNFSPLELLLCITFIVGTHILFSIISYRSSNLLPLQSIEIITLGFVLNILSGFLLEKFSPKYPMIPPAFPVFAGMCASIVFIFLHKKFVSIEVHEEISLNLKNTLLFISLLLSAVYIFLAIILEIKYTASFSVCFVFTFFIQVLLLIKIIDHIVKILQTSGKSISSNTVPIVSSLSDFFGTTFLIIISMFLSLAVPAK